MKDEKLKYYSDKYKKHQIKASFIFMLIIIIIGLILVGIGIFLIIYNPELFRIILGSIMIILGIADIPLGIKFYKSNKKHYLNLDDAEAIRRYTKIYGITIDELKENKK